MREMYTSWWVVFPPRVWDAATTVEEGEVLFFLDEGQAKEVAENRKDESPVILGPSDRVIR